MRLFLLALGLAAACDGSVSDAPGETPSERAPIALGACGDTRLGPASFVDAGARAVVVDVTSIEARLTFDPERERALGESVVRFTLGPEAGHPVLDLRQPITAAWLDGEPLAPGSGLVRREPALTRPGTVLVVRRALPSCSAHTLVVRYALRSAGRRGPPRWERACPWWTALSDHDPARLLEQWTPAPITLADTFALTLEVAVAGPGAWTLVANGEVAERARAAWRVTWPGGADVMTPLVAVCEKDKLLSIPDPSGALDLRVPVGLVGFSEELTSVVDTARAALTELEARFGPRPGDDGRPLRVLVLLDQLGGMEYPNGIVLGDLLPETVRHEVAHLWFGRGVRPARHADAWWDEGLVTRLTRHAPPIAADTWPLDPDEPDARPLERWEPWLRRTPRGAYLQGARVFETLYERFGDAAVDGALRALLAACAGRHVTHHDLGRAFAALGDRPFVAALWQRWVVPPGDADIVGTCDTPLVRP